MQEFGESIVKVYRLNRAVVFKACSGGLRSDLSNLKDYVSTLMEVIQQGSTNLKLQLNTPN